ncbi:MAG: hypothetical protein PHH26_07805 [Candidatus Thermoplasmatota archaeon]|nr:hypothetical protein [Candidatus Thermoplasmatota archaeon]
MSITAVQVADAVVTALNAGEFTREFTAVRAFLPYFTSAQLATVQVSVVPGGIEMTPVTRANTLDVLSVDIGVIKNVDPGDGDEINNLINFVHEIIEYMRGLKLTAQPNASWFKTAVDPLYSEEQLSQNKCFMSILTVSYKTLS